MGDKEVEEKLYPNLTKMREMEKFVEIIMELEWIKQEENAELKRENLGKGMGAFIEND